MQVRFTVIVITKWRVNWHKGFYLFYIQLIINNGDLKHETFFELGTLRDLIIRIDFESCTTAIFHVNDSNYSRLM